MAKGNDEAHNPKRRPGRTPKKKSRSWVNPFTGAQEALPSGPDGYVSADIPGNLPMSTPKSKEDLDALLNRLDDLAYGKKEKPKKYDKKPIEDWGLDWPED